LTRHEVERIVVDYRFDLRTNELVTTLAPNANAGLEHVFKAYRVPGDPRERVSLRTRRVVAQNAEEVEDIDEEE
jgi:hypothetical protein